MTIIVAASGDALKTYQDLQESVALWLARDDLSDEIKHFIQFAESDICKDLRVRGQEKEQVYSVTSGTQTLPSDFLEARRLYVDVTGADRSLTFLSPERFHTSRVKDLSGTPQAYTIEGNNLLVAPFSDTAVDVKMLYIGTYDALADPNDSNDLLCKHFDLYLYGALAHGFGYLRDDEQAIKWLGRYNDAVNSINTNENRSRWHGNALIRTGVATP